MTGPFDFFGGLFDFDGNGATDFAEAALGMMILDEFAKKDREDSDEFYGDDENWD